MQPFDLLRLLTRMARLHLFGQPSDPSVDYDVAAATYDQYYSRHLGEAAQSLLRQLPLKPGMQWLDVACGTGYFTRPLATAVGERGRVVAVDISAGMLERNRVQSSEQGLANIRFVQGDALAFMATLADASLDGVLCGWGICYLDHAAFRREVERVLRPGGCLGVIENRARTLGAVGKVFERVMLRHSEAMVKKMVVHLPRGHRQLRRTMCKSLLEPVAAWDGEVQVPCANGREVLQYMVRSGAAAGFLDALDPARREAVMGAFEDEAESRFRRGRPVPVLHEYSGLLALRR